MLIQNYSYQVTCNTELAEELMENAKNPNYTVNWFNFNQGSIYYNNNGEGHSVKQIDHNNKTLTLEKI